MKKALAIDMGATSIRGIIGYIEDGKIKLEEVMRFSHEIKSSNGRLRWDFDELLKKISKTIKENGNEIMTNRKKVGAFLGDFAEIGCNSVLNPGTVIGKNSNVYPLSCVRGVVPSDSIFKNSKNIIDKIRR